MILSLGVIRPIGGVTRDLHPSGRGSGAEESTDSRLGSKGIGGTKARRLVVLSKAVRSYWIGGLDSDNLGK
jgi:hypothetical protein